MRQDFLQGKFNIKIEPQTFRLRDYHRFLEVNAPDIARFKAQQQAAFDAERERWKAAGQTEFAGETIDAPVSNDDVTLAPGTYATVSPVAGSVWKVLVKPGERVSAGTPLMIVESMKMEISVSAVEAGIVQRLLCAEGAPVASGQNLVLIEQTQ